ncbi:Bacterial regulatory protein, luxR family [compost metagenome]
MFSLPELSFLKSLSDTLLPLIERHAQISRQILARQPRQPLAELDQAPLAQVFDERLALSDIALSVREKEVCLGLLTGGTVPQMAEKLRVKNSSIETYLKRATAKLGVSGRHGLAKWMAGA